MSTSPERLSWATTGASPSASNLILESQASSGTVPRYRGVRRLSKPLSRRILLAFQPGSHSCRSHALVSLKSTLISALALAGLAACGSDTTGPSLSVCGVVAATTLAAGEVHLFDPASGPC